MKTNRCILLASSLMAIFSTATAFAAGADVPKIDTLGGSCKAKAVRAVFQRLRYDAKFRDQADLELSDIPKVAVPSIDNPGPNSPQYANLLTIALQKKDISAPDHDCRHYVDVTIKPLSTVVGNDPDTGETGILEADSCDILSLMVDSNPVDCG